MPRMVLLLGRDPSELKNYERKALRSRYGTDIMFERLDVADADALKAKCLEKKPFALLLPPEIPTGGNKDHVDALVLAIFSRVVSQGVLVLALANHWTDNSANLGRRLGKLRPVTERQRNKNFDFNI